MAKRSQFLLAKWRLRRVGVIVALISSLDFDANDAQAQQLNSAFPPIYCAAGCVWSIG